MATAAEYEAQLNDIRSNMDQYTPTNLGDVTRDLMSKVNFFQPQFAEKRGIEAGAQSYLPQFMEQYFNRFGQGGGMGPSAFNMLGSGLGEVNRQLGTAGTIGDVIGRAGGRIEDLAKSSVDQYNSAKDSLMQKYNMTMPFWQQAKSEEEAARARAAQAAMYSGFGDYGQNGGQSQDQAQQTPTGEVSYINPSTAINAAVAGIHGGIGNAVQNAYFNNGVKQIKANPFAYGGIDKALKALGTSSIGHTGGQMAGRLF